MKDRLKDVDLPPAGGRKADSVRANKAVSQPEETGFPEEKSYRKAKENSGIEVVRGRNAAEGN